MSEFFKLLIFLAAFVFILKYTGLIQHCVLAVFSIIFGTFIGSIIQGLIFGFSQSFLSTSVYWITAIIAGIGFYSYIYFETLQPNED